MRRQRDVHRHRVNRGGSAARGKVTRGVGKASASARAGSASIEAKRRHLAAKAREENRIGRKIEDGGVWWLAEAYEI